MAVLTCEKTKVYKSSDFSSNQFSIAATPEAFCILSDRLYSDKIGAIIRELSTNAADAHIAAHSEQLFDVHLPSIVEPWFKIRDYGVGLAVKVYHGEPDITNDTNCVFTGSYIEAQKYVDKLLSDLHQDDDENYTYTGDEDLRIVDEAMVMYTTYFYSNKIHSNDFTGQLGLGSKSPFAYTDSFEVIVYYHGEKRTYNCNLNEDKIPEINYIEALTCKTDEHDGLEVSFAVQQEDIYAFIDRAQAIYCYFNKPPNVSNSDRYKHIIHSAVVKGNNWALCDTTSCAQAIMGNVAYPINYKAKGLSDEHAELLGLHLDIRFNIGDLDVTPSREALSYNQRTIKNLEKALNKIVQEVEIQVSKKFEAVPTLWEARCLAYELFYSHNCELSILSKIANISEVKWKGQELGDFSIDIEDIPDLKVLFFKSRQKYNRRWSSYSQSYNKIVEKKEITKINPIDKMKFYERDLPRGAHTRISNQIHEEKIETACLIEFGTNVARSKFIDRLGLTGNEFLLVSTLPKVSYKKGTQHSSNAQAFIHNESENQPTLYRFWQAETIDLDKGGVYVELHRYKAKRGMEIIAPSTLGYILRLLKETQYDVPTIVGVRPQIVKKIRKHNDWIDFWEHSQNLVQQDFDSRNLPQHMANVRGLDNLKHLEFWSNLASSFVPHDTDSKLKVFLEHVRYLQKSRPIAREYHRLEQLCSALKIPIKSCIMEHDIIVEEKEITKIYPILGMVSRWQARFFKPQMSDIDCICQCINMQDTTKHFGFKKLPIFSDNNLQNDLPF